MGLVTQKNVRMYWENGTNVPQVTSAFTRNRFLQILRYLHFTNMEVTNETSTRQMLEDKTSFECIEKQNEFNCDRKAPSG